MRSAVLLTAAAQRDLEELHSFVVSTDSPRSADRLLDALQKMMGTLSISPERGGYPRELLALGIHEYRQLLVKSYRIIYRIASRTVYIHLITDGRRDMRALLERRLLGD
jgi:toxin ParE1/3/4